MPKDVIPKILPVSPLSLVCPHCKAKPNQDCFEAIGGFGVMHVARIRAAAAKDMNNRKIRDKKNQS